MESKMPSWWVSKRTYWWVGAASDGHEYGDFYCHKPPLDWYKQCLERWKFVLLKIRCKEISFKAELTEYGKSLYDKA